MLSASAFGIKMCTIKFSIAVLNYACQIDELSTGTTNNIMWKVN